MGRPPLKGLLAFILGLGAFGLLSVTASAESTPPQPAAAQPTLPGAKQAAPPKPGSPVVEQLVEGRPPPLVVRKEKAAHRIKPRPRHIARRHRLGPALERPALAGVELVEPIPPPSEPPHVVVPTPAFPLDSVAAAFLTPPPPIVCRPTRRDPSQPDPHLYKERPVECEPDDP